MKIGKNYKKILTWVLLFTMIFTTFSACGKKTEEVTETTAYAEDENIIDDKFGTCYQVLIYSFCDSDGDGIGDFNGLTSKLDYIKDLGFSSIWLLPFNTSTTYHKYDVVDYYTIDDDYGTMEDYDNFIKACDEKNIDVYMDFVINHTSSQNQWFIDAAKYVRTLGDEEEIDYQECPYAEYYSFKRADSKPTGWNKLSGTKDWYYESVFWDQMPDLNLDSTAVREEIEKIASFWIDKGIKGFRLDAALHYYEGNNTKSVEALKWFYDYVESIDPKIYCVAEVWDTFSTIQEFYESGVDSLFNFVLGNKDGLFVKTVNRMGNGKAGANLSKNLVMLQETFSAINPDYVDGVFLSNHDTGRAAGFLSRDEDKVKLGAGLEILSTGCVFVYYGDELGMSGSGEDPNKRAPMYWTADTQAEGMTVGPPGMVAQEHEFGAYDTQKEDSTSVYQYYKKAIHLRNKYPEIGRGTLTQMTEVTDANGNLCGLAKEYDGSTIYVIYNISKESITVDVSKDTYKYKELSDYLCTGEEIPTLVGESLTIPAYGCVILK